ncbi:Lycopene beta-cyclase [Piedraia hortae CBS 480.64]|uniref:Bifunctional lycopene cyclase/phytoene synthase n=1 Tax=Piedraia hortae CBS 480.64 TaxID=1314780 RepID=A0A6A7C280_9PEZI|nr:Lycopene beta-cyclase [Piedraia hortae CBS 480.64]
MGIDYALVHVTYTIPPAILLTLVSFPLLTQIDVCKIAFHIFIAVIATTPWDSYLIRSNVWTYPPEVIMGPTLFGIPVEEVFFFVIQTYNTALLYTLVSKSTLHSIYLVREDGKKKQPWKLIRLTGQVILALVIKQGYHFIKAQGDRTYLGLILVWAVPVLWLIWTLAYQFLINLPLSNTLLPIAIPTIYLWVVDTLALKRGTWVIESGTKTGLTLWPGLEIEEAIFFLLTNTLIVSGMVAFDNAMAVLYTFPAHFPRVPRIPGPKLLAKALLLPASTYDDDRIQGLHQCINHLHSHSRSFYLASSTFQGRLRIDLILLYSFCRLADNYVDNAKSTKEAKVWIGKFRRYLDLCYSGGHKQPNGAVVDPKDRNQGQAIMFAMRQFPPQAHLTLLLLPTQYLDKEPLYELLRGFEMDLAFTPSLATGPIKTESDLDLYGARVAGTVAHLCIQLVLYHDPGTSEGSAKRMMAAGRDMGLALQYVNVARDLSRDAQDGRLYLPPTWLRAESLSSNACISTLRSMVDPASSAEVDKSVRQKIEKLRSRLLNRAFAFYESSRDEIENLPRSGRAAMRVAVESYMQIGKELQNDNVKIKAGQATVPLGKRLLVGWRALLGPMQR